jgi:hypothetical protein
MGRGCGRALFIFRTRFSTSLSAIHCAAWNRNSSTPTRMIALSITIFFRAITPLQSMLIAGR